jgi:hypothetical protein
LIHGVKALDSTGKPIKQTLARIDTHKDFYYGAKASTFEFECD